MKLDLLQALLRLNHALAKYVLSEFQRALHSLSEEVSTHAIEKFSESGALSKEIAL